VPADLVRELRGKGLSFREIARRTGYGYGSVRRAFYGHAGKETAPRQSAIAGENGRQQ
jgi:lambda repressor-like predicted transcriptional regulator